MNRESKKYQIAFLIDGLSMGGAERLMVPILKHLSRQDFEPRVGVLQVKEGNPMADAIRALDVPVDYLQIERLRDLSALPRLLSYLRQHHIDLVHTQLEFSNILGNLSAKLLHLPSVCTVHVLPPSDVKAKTKLHQRAEFLFLRLFCDRIISVSEDARIYHMQMAGFSPQKIQTIYNGIDLTEFQNHNGRDRAVIRQEFGIPTAAKVLTTVAVLRAPKGIEYMIRAMPGVLAREPDTYYLVVGDGPRREALLKEASKLALNERVIFAGMRKDVADLLAASDVFVLPTLTEALPTVLAEAMALRLPIVASAVGGIPEMISNGKSGYLVKPGNPAELSDVCLKLLSSSESRRSMGDEGLKIAHQKFSIETQVDQMRDLYLELLRRYGK